ncbi:MAG TPA: hypothetical protein VNI83_13865 [Vicinamibacterales bacterium]|nr:hypothetical protein [Vicinamibacterales bacterium]
MAHPQIAVFARLADGNDARVRAIEGQATLLGRTMHAIAYDPVHDEIVVPQQFGQGILTFRGAASGEEPPIRVIRGPRTQLIALDRLAVDPVNDEIYVPEGEKVLVFPREANGDVAPIRVLAGPDTRIHAARSVAIDPVRNLLVVASTPPRGRRESGGGDSSEEGGAGRNNELTIFERTASGNARPLRVITGLGSSWNIALYPERGLIFVVQRGYVGVWHVDDNGPVPPRFTIGGPKGVLQEPRGVTIDVKHRAVIVSDKQLNAVLTFDVPQLFETTEARR